MRKIVFLLCGILGFHAAHSLFASEQITKVGVVDLHKVTTTFFRESKAMRDIEDQRTQMRDEVAEIEQQISELERQVADAQLTDDPELTLGLDEQLFQLQQHLRNYLSIKNRQIQQMAARLTETDSFLTELTMAIEQVAEKEGYSLILNLNSNDILFYIPEIDITDLVINMLHEQAGR